MIVLAHFVFFGVLLIGLMCLIRGALDGNGAAAILWFFLFVVLLWVCVAGLL